MHHRSHMVAVGFFLGLATFLAGAASLGVTAIVVGRCNVASIATVAIHPGNRSPLPATAYLRSSCSKSLSPAHYSVRELPILTPVSPAPRAQREFATTRGELGPDRPGLVVIEVMP